MLIGEVIPELYRYLRNNPAAPERAQTEIGQRGCAEAPCGVQALREPRRSHRAPLATCGNGRATDFRAKSYARLRAYCEQAGQSP